MTTLTICVIAAFVAAAVIALAARPVSSGPVRQYLLAGDLQWCNPAPASVTVVMNDDCTVTLTRHGLEGLTDTGALSLAILVKGFDVRITERRTDSGVPGAAVDTAVFTLDFLARERYSFTYFIGEHPAAAFAMTLRPGARYTARLGV